MTTLSFDGRVAIVTGAGRGIGRAHALLLASRGASVVVNDIGVSVEGGGADGGPAHEVTEEIKSAGGNAFAHNGDISSVDGAQSLVDAAVTEFGRLDIVINNAGIIRWADFPEADVAELDAHLKVHTAGAFNVTRSAWPHLASQGYGRVVMTTSSAVFGAANLVSYGAAKGSVIGLARCLAIAGKDLGIAVNVVSPIALTRMVPTIDEYAKNPEQMAARSPELVSSVVAYLVHESCSANGEIYAAGGSRAARVFIAETDGHISPGLTPEAVRDNWSEINDVSSFFIPTSSMDHVAKRRALLEKAGVPLG